jgi:hypothetical protein
MFPGITTHTGSLVTPIVVLTGAASLRGGAAAADPSQDDQFLALLNEEGIPALQNVPSLIATASPQQVEPPAAPQPGALPAVAAVVATSVVATAAATTAVAVRRSRRRHHPCRRA